MVTHMHPFPAYAVSPATTYVCKYCGAYLPLSQFTFHTCRKGR